MLLKFIRNLRRRFCSNTVGMNPTYHITGRCLNLQYIPDKTRTRPELKQDLLNLHQTKKMEKKLNTCKVNGFELWWSWPEEKLV